MAGVQIEIRSARRAHGAGGDGGLPSARLGHLLVMGSRPVTYRPFRTVECEFRDRHAVKTITRAEVTALKMAIQPLRPKENTSFDSLMLSSAVVQSLHAADVKNERCPQTSALV
jgi:hypothetical protein